MMAAVVGVLLLLTTPQIANGQTNSQPVAPVCEPIGIVVQDSRWFEVMDREGWKFYDEFTEGDVSFTKALEFSDTEFQSTGRYNDGLYLPLRDRVTVIRMWDLNGKKMISFHDDGCAFFTLFLTEWGAEELLGEEA